MNSPSLEEKKKQMNALRQGNLVPPPQFNVFAAPPYTPTPAPARAGSDDHKRIASRGVRC